MPRSSWGLLLSGSFLPPPLRCEGYWGLYQHQAPLLTIYFHWQIVRVQPVPERGQTRCGEFIHKAERRRAVRNSMKKVGSFSGNRAGWVSTHPQNPCGGTGVLRLLESRIRFIAPSDGMVTGRSSEGSGVRRCPGSGPWSVPRVSATCPNPAWRPKPPSHCPPIPPNRHQPLPRASPEPRRSLAVVPLIQDQRCYGETPARLWRNERAAGDAIPPVPPRIAKCPKVHRKSLNRRELRDQHGRYAVAPPWSLRAATV